MSALLAVALHQCAGRRSAARAGSCAYSRSWRWRATAVAVAAALTTALFRMIGPKRTRLVAQIVAAVIGAGFVIGLQLAAIVSHGTLSRLAVLPPSRSSASRPTSAASSGGRPARCSATRPRVAGVLGAGLVLLGAAILLVAPRFADCAIAAAGASRRPRAQRRRAPGFRSASPRRHAAAQGMDAAAARSLADVADADAIALSAAARVPAVAQLRRAQRRARSCWSRCWSWRPDNSRAGSPGSPSRARTRPIWSRPRRSPRRTILRAKIEAVMGSIADGVRAVHRRAGADRRRSARWSRASGSRSRPPRRPQIQLCFRAQAKRSQFRRRQTSSRVATFAEAFVSIAWAATAALAAAGTSLAGDAGRGRGRHPGERPPVQSAQSVSSPRWVPSSGRQHEPSAPARLVRHVIVALHDRMEIRVFDHGEVVDAVADRKQRVPARIDEPLDAIDLTLRDRMRLVERVRQDLACRRGGAARSDFPESPKRRMAARTAISGEALTIQIWIVVGR